MFHRILAVLAVALCATLLAGAALAAQPTKGGVYEGSLYATSSAALPKKVRLVVASTGKSLRVIWSCGTGRAPSTLRMPIAADGTFKGSSNVGTVTVWKIAGRFVSQGTARAALTLKTICDGKGGTVVLQLQQ